MDNDIDYDMIQLDIIVKSIPIIHNQLESGYQMRPRFQGKELTFKFLRKEIYNCWNIITDEDLTMEEKEVDVWTSLFVDYLMENISNSSIETNEQVESTTTEIDSVVNVSRLDECLGSQCNTEDDSTGTTLDSLDQKMDTDQTATEKKDQKIIHIEDKKQNIISTKDKNQMPTEDTNQIIMPTEDKNQKMLPTEVKDSKMMPTEDKNQKMLPTEDKDSKMMPIENKNQKMLPTEDKIQKMMPTEVKDSKMMPTKDKNKKMLPTEVKDSKMMPTEDKNQKMLPTEVKDSKMMPTEDKNQKMLPTEVKDSKMMPTEDKNQKMMPPNKTSPSADALSMIGEKTRRRWSVRRILSYICPCLKAKKYQDNNN